jgi:hypothetical protein
MAWPKFNGLRQMFRRRAPKVDPEKQKVLEQKITQLAVACKAGDLAAVCGMTKDKGLPREAFMEALAGFLMEHKIFDGLEPLVAASNIRKDPQLFVYQLLNVAENPEHQNALVKFFNQNQVPFRPQDIIGPLRMQNAEACKNLMDSGRFDPRGDNSAALLYSAMTGNKDVFMELVKRGANPQEALVAGPEHDPGLKPAYQTLAAWLHEVMVGNLTNAVTAGLNEKLAKLPAGEAPQAETPQAAGAPQETRSGSSTYDPFAYAPAEIREALRQSMAAATPAASPQAVVVPAPQPVPAAVPQETTEKPARPPIDFTLYGPK